MGNQTSITGPAEFLAGYEVVDLSVLLADNYPCYWPTIMGYHASVFHRIGEWMGPFFTRYMIMEEHVGTHCDAPAHFIPTPETGLPHASEYGRVTVELVPLDQFIGSAVVVDCRSLRGKAKPGECPIISVDLLRKWERDNGPFVKGDAVLLRTDWTDDTYRPMPEGKAFGHAPILERSVPGWPSPDDGAMTYLAEAGVRLVGHDGNSIGPLQNDGGPHWAGLGAGMVFVERLIHLGKLPTRGALFVFLPIKCEGAGGAPGRAMAFRPRAS